MKNNNFTKDGIYRFDTSDFQSDNVLEQFLNIAGRVLRKAKVVEGRGRNLDFDQKDKKYLTALVISPESFLGVDGELYTESDRQLLQFCDGIVNVELGEDKGIIDRNKVFYFLEQVRLSAIKSTNENFVNETILEGFDFYDFDSNSCQKQNMVEAARAILMRR